MIFFSNDQEFYMRCAGCDKVNRVQILAVGADVKPENVIPVCDDCRAEIARQAALPVITKEKPAGQVIRVKFGHQSGRTGIS